VTVTYDCALPYPATAEPLTVTMRVRTADGRDHAATRPMSVVGWTESLTGACP